MKKIITNLFYLALFFLITLSGAIFYIAYHPFVDFSVLEYYNPGKPTIVYDDQFNEILRFQVDRRDIVSINDIPPHVVNAFLAAEDHNFFKHGGISLRAIARSILVNLYHFKNVQGASTITQQLVKLLYFNSKKSYLRKIKEQILSIIVERQFAKDQILEIYLNHVCFGHGIYGVEAASQRFWGKSVKDIDIAQAAVLAGIVRSPSRYCPLSDISSCKKRRNVVLNSMCRLTRCISSAEYEVYITEPLEIIKSPDKINGHLKEYLTQVLEEMVGKKLLYNGGLKIVSTINLKAQLAAQDAFNGKCEKLRSKFKLNLNGALISLQTNTSAIKSMVGGLDYSKSQFNRAIKAERQMGSIFKPLILAKALENRINQADVLIDEPTTFEFEDQLWSPHNYNNAFEGPMTLAYALSRSNNIIIIKTLLNTGISQVIELAKKCGLRVQNAYPSLALGCVDATLLQSAAMFNVFANSGNYNKPYIINWIKNEWGQKIYQHKQNSTNVIDSKINSQVAKILTIAMKRYESLMGDKWIKSEVIGKTGTTNDVRTCWFVGSTPELTTAVYIGLDDNSPMGDQAFPIHTAFPIWLDFNRKIEKTKKTFKYDPTLVVKSFNQYTGQEVAPNSPDSIELLVDA